MRYPAYLGLVVTCSALAGCGAFQEPPPPPPFQVAFVVEGDPGKKIGGAEIQRGGKTVATTDTDGRAKVDIKGAEGEVTEAVVVCPTGYLSPSKPTPVRLTRLAGATVPEFTVQCPPTRRRIVVAVRADNGANLPVTYLNQVVATTDATGAAHFALDLEPGAFQVGIDTSDRKDIKPQSPRRTFNVQKDDILVFDEKFQVEKKIVRVVKAKRAVCISCDPATGG